MNHVTAHCGLVETNFIQLDTVVKLSIVSQQYIALVGDSSVPCWIDVLFSLFITHFDIFQTQIQQTSPPNELSHRPLNSPTPTPKLSPSKSQAEDESHQQR